VPIYEYVCEKCSYKFELLKSKMVKNSKEKCPKCGGVSKQQLSTFGVGSSGHVCDGTCHHGSSCEMGGECGGCPCSGM